MWEAVNAVTGPLSLVLGAYVLVPAFHAVRHATGLSPARAAGTIAIPFIASTILAALLILRFISLAFG